MSITPSTRPKMTRAEIEAITGKVDKAVLVFLRGYYKQSFGNKDTNDVGYNDDAAFLISPTVFIAFNANTDPSKLGQGLAMLKVGTYRYYKGKHLGAAAARKGLKGYDALRPYPNNCDMPCTRDGVDSIAHNTNIHHGEINNTTSAGCLTIYKPQYDEFIKTTYLQMSKYRQDTIEVILREA